MYSKYKKATERSISKRAEISNDSKKLKLLNWIDEQHRCESCGKIMTEYYGSGRFCSKSCANTRHQSTETREKISKRTSEALLSRGVKDSNMCKYLMNPKYCAICGKQIEYDRRYSNVCEDETCKNNWIGIRNKGKTGGIRPGTGTSKHGCYKGFYCDSTYELVYIIYNIDHDIKFERNTKYYWYATDDGIYRYYPDFILEDGTLVEIKGWLTDVVYYKINAVDDAPIQLLMKKDLKYAFDYVKETYTYKNLYDLYDKQ